MKQLYTRWGRDLDPQNVLQEYPRPLLKRGSYINLNGYWDYTFTKYLKKPEQYDGQILVPFSPEAVLSEIGGHTYREPGHSACEELYGYGACKDKEALGKAYRELMRKAQALIPQGLCASVYTQWTDIEEEINGVYTWDREVRKIF